MLAEMNKALTAPKDLQASIPRILGLRIPPEWLGKVIGPKGKTVQMLIDTYRVTDINLEDDGSVQVVKR